jgi:hypothetical protein
MTFLNARLREPIDRHQHIKFTSVSRKTVFFDDL